MAGYKDYLDMSPKQLMSLSRKELAKAVTIIDSAANKRMKRLRQAGVDSPELKSFESTSGAGSKFSVKGKSLNDLRQQFVQTRNFMKAKTSSLGGAKKVQSNLMKRLNIPKGQKLTPDQEKLLWKAYNNFVDSYGGDPDNKQKIYDSNQIQVMITEQVRNGEDFESIMQNLDSYMGDIYEQNTEEELQSDFSFVGADNPFT